VRRRLDVELVRRGLAPTRTQAGEAIAAGRVRVGGAPATTSARLVAPAEPVALVPPAAEYVSRGGQKLARGLDAFGIDAAGRRALDAGASTGGFTDCLLQRGADRVTAVDVGRGQLAWRLRADPRVVVRERTDVRGLTPDDLGGPVDLLVADLSFVSLRAVAVALAGLCAPDADLVLLVKPQFEAGRARIGKGGIVRDSAVHRAVLGEVVAGLAEAGIGVRAVVPSPVRGADGNVEFLVHAAIGPATLAADAIADAVRAAHDDPDAV